NVSRANAKPPTAACPPTGVDGAGDVDAHPATTIANATQTRRPGVSALTAAQLTIVAASVKAAACYPRPLPSMADAISGAYRLLYDFVLSRLPEARAVALGQAVFRVLPLDRLGVFRLEDPRLRTTLGGVRLANPLVFAAQYYDVRILARLMGLGFGAVTAKTITREPRPGHPPPNLARVRTAAGPGLVNCNGFQNPGVERFRAQVATLPHRAPLIVSVAGESADDYLVLARALAPFGDLVEFNVSSPNTRLVYAWSTRPAELTSLLKAAGAAATKPLIVKRSPDCADVNEAEIIPAALEAGVRIVNYGNTRRIEEGRLSQGSGGLSGPEIFPATLANVRRTRARFGDRLEI